MLSEAPVPADAFSAPFIYTRIYRAARNAQHDFRLRLSRLIFVRLLGRRLGRPAPR